MRSNVRHVSPVAYTHEGARTKALPPEVELRRTIMSCMLFEDTFYESGDNIAARLKNLVPACRPEFVAQCAIIARERMKLRHAPLYLAACMTFHDSHKGLVGALLPAIIQRADELAEFVAIYYKLGSKHLSAQVKKGLAQAFLKFNEYELAKYNRDYDWTLRDVAFMVRPRAGEDVTKGQLLARLVNKDHFPDFTKGGGNAKGRFAVKEAYGLREFSKLEIPDTWETQLSGGADKCEVFTRLMNERKLGALAFLRNLRNMAQAKVDATLIERYASNLNVERVLPFRFIAAARHAPQFISIIEPLMIRCAMAQERFDGPTALLVDHSRSMEGKVSQKSEISCFDAATAIGILMREVCPIFRTFTFSDRCVEVPAYRGFALADSIKSIINPVGTMLGKAVSHVYHHFPECVRLIVVTDEQSHDRPLSPLGRGYIINVAVYKNGVGYDAWTHINGWSEGVIDFMREAEREEG